MGEETLLEGGAMKKIRLRAGRPIWRWLAVFGFSFVLATPAHRGGSLL